MSATKELHRLLDEQGIEYREYQPNPFEETTAWDLDVSDIRHEVYASFEEFDSGSTLLKFWNCTPGQAVEATLGREITGETSDGYHTFNELYHHRAVLFSVIVRDHRELAWKSKAHHDGTMYEGMFIVGIETPEGQATYHYDIDPYWDMFDCKELDRAPEWDGHTPDDAIGRIATLGRGMCHIKPWEMERDTGFYDCMQCDCGMVADVGDWAEWHFCPNCGRRVTEVDE